ncbi:glycerol dehydrogenase [Klebsiella sp. T2.Ur]|nr:glycerol dehydrogenase [Klebsiella sp. T2.Ur]
MFKTGLKGCSVKFNFECTEKEVSRLGDIAFRNESNVVVGIGGGKTLDSAKVVAHRCGLPVILYPTTASTDAPCTALAVIYNEKGEFEHYLFLPQNPDAVIADVSIIASAPSRFFAAGVGDALATWFEARACYRADGLNLVQKKPSRTGLGIAELCYKLLRENVELAMDAINNKVTTPALEQIIEATIYLSGVGAEAGGLAAAHAVNNGMSLIPELHHVQHGEKVAFGLLVQLILEKAPIKEIEEVIRIIKTVNLPLTLEDMGLKTFNTSDWNNVAELACSKDDTMSNMPMKIVPNDVYNAIIVANTMAHRYK